MRDFLQLAVDAQLNAADCQQANPGFGLAGFDLVADPELPSPDPRRFARYHRVFHALVVHESPPASTQRT